MKFSRNLRLITFLLATQDLLCSWITLHTDIAMAKKQAKSTARITGSGFSVWQISGCSYLYTTQNYFFGMRFQISDQWCTSLRRPLQKPAIIKINSNEYSNRIDKESISIAVLFLVNYVEEKPWWPITN